MQACIICSAGLASCRCLQLTSNVRPLKLRVASYSKLVRSPFSLGTNAANATTSFLHIFGVRAGPSSLGYVRISQRGFKAVSHSAFHQRSCVRYSRTLRRDPSSKFVKCASRRRAAPRSQLVEAATSRRRPALRVASRFSYTEDAAVVGSARNTVALQAPAHAVQRRSNPSVNRRANGRPRYTARKLSLPRGRPLTPGYLKR